MPAGPAAFPTLRCRCGNGGLRSFWGLEDYLTTSGKRGTAGKESGLDSKQSHFNLETTGVFIPQPPFLTQSHKASKVPIRAQQ